MFLISETKKISFNAKVNELDKVIEKKGYFKISSRALIFLNFAFLFLVTFLLFKSADFLMIAFGIMFSVVFFVAFTVSIYKDVVTIDFKEDYFTIKYQFFTRQYSYTELSNIDIYFFAMKYQTIVSLTLGKYGEEVVIRNNEPLELFFYAQYAFNRFFKNQEYSYSEIYQMLNDQLKNEIKTIAILNSRYQLI